MIPAEPQLRAIILTSTSPRHHFLVHAVSEQLDVVGVWREVKAFAPASVARSDADRPVLAQHMAERDASERAYFGSHVTLQAAAGALVRDVPPGGSNDPRELALMRALMPEVVVVFGTELLRTEAISTFAGRLVNLHLGLSPYYRGSGTNFWPLVNGEPEYVGATVHYLDRGIDSGPVITQVRPAIHRGDGPHDIGHRAIATAAPVVAAVAAAHCRCALRATPQDHSRGRLYRRKDFGAEAVHHMRRQFSGGMIDRYLEQRAARDARVALIAPAGPEPDMATGVPTPHPPNTPRG